MRKKLLTILFFLTPLMVYGQLHSLSNQYIVNGLAINPAYSGADGALSATLMYRNQWTGFTGAPKTITAALHAPLRNERVGLGLMVVNDQIGVNNQTTVMANYAYIIEMGDGKLAFGFGLGISMLNVSWDKLQATDENDNGLNISPEKLTNPNFSAGLFYHNKEFFVGFSTPMLLSYSYSGENATDLELKNDFSEYNFYLTSGYKLELNNDYTFFPSLITKFNPGEAFQADVSAQFILRNKLWLGLTYRSVDALVAIVQFQVTDQLRLAYSYDTGLSGNSRQMGGSHEIMLNYLFNYNSKVVGPKRF